MTVTINGAGPGNWDSSGNLGIGTSTPNQKLQVHNPIASSSLVQMTNASTGSTSSDGCYFGIDASGNAYAWNQENGPILFGTNNGERARIDTSGNLLVGATSTFTSSGLSFCVGTTSGGMQLGGNGTQGYYGAIYPSNRGIEHVNAATAGSPRAYYFTTQSGSAYTSLNASAFNVSSDYRLKENIQPLTGALNRLSLLKPSRFNYKTDIETRMPFGENTVDGFIAHEVSVAVPEAVSGEKDALHDDGKINPQSLDTSKLIPLLTAAIQELNAKVDAQAAEIAALKAA